MQDKKRYDVTVIGATVCFFVKEQRLGLLDSVGYIHWIDLQTDKTFSRMPFKEGGRAWVYIAKDLKRVVSVMYDNGEKIEDLPAMEPICE